MSRSTTHRYVITLVALGFLEQDAASRKYRLGLRANDLGVAALHITGLHEPALPSLEQLREQTSYTTGLAMLDCTEIVYVQRVRSSRAGQVESALNQRAGARLPVQATAAGKVLLAHLPKADLHKLLDTIDLTAYTASTITSRRRLMAELQRVYQDGHAISDQEWNAGVRAIAAPVVKDGEIIAAVDVTVYAHALSAAALTGFVPELATAAERIEHSEVGNRSSGW
jgi:IclR family pca regulon transcriptional regulator